MKFNYQARTGTGEIQSGTVEASSKEAALTVLQKYNLYVTFLEETGLEPTWAKKIKLFERISKQEIAIFFRQLAIMFKSKVPIIEAIYVLAKQTQNLSFREKINKIAGEVEGGTPLSQAFSLYPDLFSYFYISMVKSGEVSGKLSQSLEYLANHLEREYTFQSKLKGAMVYPLFVVFVFIIVVSVMVVFIIPRMAEVLTESGQELPLLTKTIINISLFFKSWGLVIILLLAGLIFFIFRYSKTAEGKKFFDKSLLKLPILGDLFKKIYISRFAENLSTLITAGLPISQALEITGEIVGNDVYHTIIIQTRDEVRKGEQISTTFEKNPQFIPPILFQMTLTGEKTGNLDETLLDVVNFYQKEIEQKTNTLISLLEPLMIVFLGGLVGIIVASILLPLYQMGGI
jgi:type IV pilus assembly protein PilC